MMGRVARSVVRFLKSEDGPTTVQVAVVLAFIIVLCVFALTQLGTTTKGALKNDADMLAPPSGS